MAHYIAELIVGTEVAAGESQAESLDRCAAAIQELWRHRYELPDHSRPFRELEPIARALASLDPRPEYPRYFRHEMEPPSDEGESAKWFGVAKSIDSAAKMLIAHCLARAAETALDKSEEWVALAAGAALDDGIESVIIRFIRNKTDFLDVDLNNAKERKEIENRLARLNEFRKSADALAADLSHELSRIHQS